MNSIENALQKETSSANRAKDRPERALEKWLIYATGAVAAVVLNALSGAGDHPHLAAMLIRWFAAIPLLVAAIYFLGLVFFGHYKVPETREVDPRPKWLISTAHYLTNKTPEKLKTVIVWFTETYILVILLGASAFGLFFGWLLLVDGFELFNQVNSLLYQQQLEALRP